MNFYVTYTGSKRTDFKEYAECLFNIIEKNNIKTIVEPFAGSGIQSAYIYDKFGDKLNYHLNDIDSVLIDFLNDMKNKNYGIYVDELKKFEYIRQMKDGKEKCAAVRKIRTIYENDKTAVNFFCRQKIMPIQGKIRCNNNFDFDFNNKRFHKYTNFITSNKVELSNSDYMEIIDKYKNDETALLLYDPPYFMSDNTDYSSYANRYSDDKKTIADNTAMFVNIIKNFYDKNASFYIINHTALIDYLMHDFYIAQYNKTYAISKNKTIHNIYCNRKN